MKYSTCGFCKFIFVCYIESALLDFCLKHDDGELRDLISRENALIIDLEITKTNHVSLNFQGLSVKVLKY